MHFQHVIFGFARKSFSVYLRYTCIITSQYKMFEETYGTRKSDLICLIAYVTD